MHLKSLSVFIILLFSGCSTVNVVYDYNPEINFGEYKSFDWLTIPQEQNSARNTLMDNRIKSAVSNTLDAKGYQLKEDSPDFLVTYHTGVKDKVNVTNYGYNYARRGRYAWIGSEIEVKNYKEGTLVIDFIDAESRELFWRGVATGSLPKKITPETIQEKINEAVNQTLKNYPPGKNK